MSEILVKKCLTMFANKLQHGNLQFKIWFDEAVSQGLSEPNAMTLATASKDGRPYVLNLYSLNLQFPFFQSSCMFGVKV